MTYDEEQGAERPINARALLDAVVAMSSDLDLHSVLERIVASACQLTGARFGALGVVGNRGELTDFVTSGMTPAEHATIGELPRGLGILGRLIEEPQALRLDTLSAHPASFGFPPGHPPMDSFLGVPVRIRGTVFGNLYLTEKAGAEPFSEQDELVVQALARSAGFVIDNARSFALGERRRQWLEASAQIVEALQPPVHSDVALQLIVTGVRRVLGALGVGVVHRDRDDYVLNAVAGPGSEAVADLAPSLAAEIRRAESGGELVLVPVGERGTVVIAPLRAHLAPPGVLLVVLKAGHGTLQTDEAELLGSFADQASLALDRAQSVTDREELMLVTDRNRIARDLHDLVIQRLFATGLQLQAALRVATGDDVRQRVDAAVVDLDVTIQDIRSTIFELQHDRDGSLKADILGVVQEYVPVLGFKPTLRTRGPVDTSCPAATGTQMLAVLREALSNIARHADAGAATVEVEVTAHDVTVRVTDDGRGLPRTRRESGLRNVRRRAVDLGGTVRFSTAQPRGTQLEWTVPLAGADED